MKNRTIFVLSLFSISLNAMEAGISSESGSENNFSSLYLNLSDSGSGSGIYGRNTGFNFPKTGSKKVYDIVNNPEDASEVMKNVVKPIGRKERILIENAIKRQQNNVHVKDKQMNAVFNAVALQSPIEEPANKTVKKQEETSYFKYLIGGAVGFALAASNPALAEKVAEVAFKSVASSVYGGYVGENLVPGGQSFDLSKLTDQQKKVIDSINESTASAQEYIDLVTNDSYLLSKPETAGNLAECYQRIEQNKIYIGIVLRNESFLDYRAIQNGTTTVEAVAQQQKAWDEGSEAHDKFMELADSLYTIAYGEAPQRDAWSEKK